MKIAVISDTHLGENKLNAAILDYGKRYFATQLFPILKARGIKTLLHLGDLFDEVPHATPAFRDIFFNPLQELGVDSYFLAGNHDLSFAKDAVFTQLGFHAFSGAAPSIVAFAGRQVLMCPWASNDDLLKTFKSTSATVCVGHFVTQGFKKGSGSTSSKGFRIADFSRFKMVLSGHFGIRQAHKNITYVGPCWSPESAASGFHILDTDTLQLEFIKNGLAMTRDEIAAF